MTEETSTEHILSLRINKNLLKEIETVAQQEKMNKSDYIRKAISDAISFSEVIRYQQTFLFSPEMVQFALNLMDDLDIEKFAALSLQNGRKFLKLYLQKNIQSSIVQKYQTNKKNTITGLLIFITQSILSPTGQNWFQRIHAVWEGDLIVLTGIHTFGLKFSKFMRAYFIQFFEIFTLKEVAAKTILKENRIKLVYTGELGAFDVKQLMT